MNPLISIIIPVYNTEKYIRRCIDSVIAQSYSDWELILVDDGSTDESGKICDEYVEKDERIRVFHKANGGVSSARNVGLDNATGEWVSFVDSDDWVEESYLQNYIDDISADIQMVVQGIILDKETTTVVSLPKLYLINRMDLVMLLEKTKGINNGYLPHKLFRMDLIKDNNIRFNEIINFAEDGLFVFYFLNHANAINITDRTAYHYNIHDGTLTSNMNRMPLEHYKIVIDGIIGTTLSWCREEDCNEVFENRMIEYCWRLINSWVFERALVNNDMASQLFVVETIGRYKLYKIDSFFDKLLIWYIWVSSFRYPWLVYRYVGLRYKINHLLK